MEKVLEDFAAYLEEHQRSPHTIAAYRRDVAAFFGWLATKTEKQIPLVEVTVFDVRKYRDHLESFLNRKPAGVNRRLAALRVFFIWAMENELASSNPAADIKGVKRDRQPPKALSSQDVYRLQREAAARRQLAEAKANGVVTSAVIAARCDEALLSLLLYTGLRVSEAANLKVDDVILNERSGKVIVRAGKGRKYRDVRLHKEPRKALAAYLQVQPHAKNDHFFLGQRGPLGPRSIQVRIAELGKAAKVEVTPHMLRHTFGTRLLREAKTDLVTVAELMGHSSVATTAIYTKPSEEDKAAAIDRLE